MLPLILFWAVEVAPTCPWFADMDKHLESLVLLCEQLFLIQLLQHTKQDAYAETLKLVQRKHHEAFLVNYGAQNMRPKHHYALHQTTQWRLERSVLDCRACEKKHSMVKSVIEATCHTLVSFEACVLSRCCIVQEKETEKLVPKHWRGHFENVNGKVSAKWPWCHVQSGQPLLWLHKDMAGIVVEVGEQAGHIHAVVSLCSLRRKIALGCYEWTKCANTCVVNLANDSSWWACDAWLDSGSELLTLW